MRILFGIYKQKRPKALNIATQSCKRLFCAKLEALGEVKRLSQPKIGFWPKGYLCAHTRTHTQKKYGSWKYPSACTKNNSFFIKSKVMLIFRFSATIHTRHPCTTFYAGSEITVGIFAKRLRGDKSAESWLQSHWMHTAAASVATRSYY